MAESKKKPTPLDKLMIGMEPLQEIVESAFFTAALDKTVPISLTLIGPPGSGKSKAILPFNGPNVHKTNDVTSIGLSEIIEDDKLGTLRHIIIPDFNIVVSHKASTSNLTVASLLSLMSEGTIRVDDGRRKKELHHAPIGIITAMTREIYEEHATRFRKLGISRRIIPLFFNYSFPTRLKIQEEIKRDRVTLQQLTHKNIELPKQAKWPISVVVNQKESSAIELLSMEMVKNLSFQPAWVRQPDQSLIVRPKQGDPPLEFTPHMVLRSMACGHALRAGRRTLTKSDIDFVTHFVGFTNYATPVLL